MPAMAQHAETGDSWMRTLSLRLPAYGHRNWVVIADSAYPLQSNPGIETIMAGEGLLQVLGHALEEISKTPHVRPIIYTDRELQFVPDSDSPGISAYRQRLSTALSNQKINTLPHEEIIHRLDEAAKTFNVLIIKTRMTLPYTSVFLQLDCAYWSTEAEQRLRQAMSAHE
jgi:hypothetical protein